jgi:hypothetical protein
VTDDDSSLRPEIIDELRARPSSPAAPWSCWRARSSVADAIAEATALGGLWIGPVLLAAGMSLTELTTDISAVRMGRDRLLAVKYFVGTCLVGLATSLPELVGCIAAVRLGAIDLVVGNLFGSNAIVWPPSSRSSSSSRGVSARPTPTRADGLDRWVFRSHDTIATRRSWRSRMIWICSSSAAIRLPEARFPPTEWRRGCC